jgi:hypothetical protein
VVGTVANGAFAPVKSNVDILGHGWVLAKLHVLKVVRGERLPAVLPVRYFAHTYMQQDQPFMLVLKHVGAGYEIETGQLMRLRPSRQRRHGRDCSCPRSAATSGRLDLRAFSCSRNW